MDNNELIPTLLAEMNNPLFQLQIGLPLMMKNVLSFRKEKTAKKNHPIISSYRFAAEHSQTCDGGTVYGASSNIEVMTEQHGTIKLARVGDKVVYHDGRYATIITGAGNDTSYGDTPLALVGSR
ncbi:hypothetical protein KKJ06_03535 [Xenorhabdus bovienii]|uniref:hypothetical protein n=1 Tax=Xenorhabdus bovienii TaxID=40576 RepID=UPI0023B22B0D|nr:hypothetical protein [Xenorhabdus bovienii]MDE9550415.1 hypothetical protein [Xenorhabdus bovienii]MDE9554534.1 hypothetical protein [Xenorhabdus bovienii]